jgi:hypothetical protein
MTTCRTVRLIGAVYFLMCLMGTLVNSLPASVLLLLFHLVMGIGATVASQDIVSAIRFSRGTAVLLGILALIELHLPSPTLSIPWSPVENGVLIVHLTTALTAAYYGYYWTDAVGEADRREDVAECIQPDSDTDGGRIHHHLAHHSGKAHDGMTTRPMKY